jgi:hypothetical protein
VAVAVEKLDAQEFHDLLDGTLRAVDSDAKAGPLLRATGMRMRFRFPDLDMVLNVTASDERDHHVRWDFSHQADREAKLELTMDSEVANAFLQGKESLAVSIARGRVQWRGDARAALLYLPATKLIIERYRRIVQSSHPDLLVA